MRQLDGLYTQADIRRQGRFGHLFSRAIQGLSVREGGALLALSMRGAKSGSRSACAPTTAMGLEHLLSNGGSGGRLRAVLWRPLFIAVPLFDPFEGQESISLTRIHPFACCLVKPPPARILSFRPLPLTTVGVSPCHGGGM